jgi:hypothetical protein
MKLSRMNKLPWILLFMMLGCKADTSMNPPPQVGGQYFTVQVTTEVFVMYVTDPATIQLATENYQGKNRRFPLGKITTGDGGYNTPYLWHFVPDSVRMTEAAIEVCDGRPSYVNAHVNDYISVGYCPWAGKIIKVGR